MNIESENMRPVTWVVVEEVCSGDWGIGGNPLTTADVQGAHDVPPLPPVDRVRFARRIGVDRAAGVRDG